MRASILLAGLALALGAVAAQAQTQLIPAQPPAPGQPVPQAPVTPTPAPLPQAPPAAPVRPPPAAAPQALPAIPPGTGQVSPRLSGPPRIGDRLAGTRWQAVSLRGKPVVKGAEPTLEFLQNGYARGSTGCNRYVGPFASRADRAVLGPMSTTRADCEPALDRQQSGFIETLEHTERMVLAEEGKVLLVYCSLGPQPSRFVLLP